MLSREWRCSGSSADRRCSDYIWVIDKFIAYYGVFEGIIRISMIHVMYWPMSFRVTLWYWGNYCTRIKEETLKYMGKIGWYQSTTKHSKTQTAWWLTHLPPSAAYMHQWIGSTLVQIMAWCLFGAKPLSKPMLSYCQFIAQIAPLSFQGSHRTQTQTSEVRWLHASVVTKWSPACLHKQFPGDLHRGN